MRRFALPRTTYLSLVTALVVLSCGPAAAQDRHVSVGAAAGVAAPLHGDFDFTAGSWQVDLQLDMSRFFVSSIFLEQWQHSNEEVLTDGTIFGPDGRVGRAERITMRTRQRARAAGWSVLARSSGRISVGGGGGLSYVLFSRDFSQSLTGCVPSSLCTDSSHGFKSSAFAAQVQAGLDVEVTRHLAMMGQFRLLVPVEDPGSGHHTVVAGMRFVF
jgi:hypothetical protein